ncbi:hypothetical protein F7D09_1927 [Bifidobacterium leontopitheci]|uniref:Uncharacterized protein n=1 Tax=Bifidobacterium leontopitheci TaxID=2650774 RepID=A0A6I1GNF1_9BIFI|nr:hypothetical protein F7D09_1927 [Bifidobacterium leontopitheci]
MRSAENLVTIPATFAGTGAEAGDGDRRIIGARRFARSPPSLCPPEQSDAVGAPRRDYCVTVRGLCVTVLVLRVTLSGVCHSARPSTVTHHRNTSVSNGSQQRVTVHARAEWRKETPRKRARPHRAYTPSPHRHLTADGRPWCTNPPRAGARRSNRCPRCRVGRAPTARIPQHPRRSAGRARQHRRRPRAPHRHRTV